MQLSADPHAGWPLCKLWEHCFSVPDLVSPPPPLVVAIAQLVVLAGKDPATTKSVFQSPWSNHLDFPFVLTAGFKKGKYEKEKFHRHMPNKLVISFKVHISRNCIFIRFFSFLTVISFPECQRLSFTLTEHSLYICYCYSFCYCSFLKKICFERSVVSKKEISTLSQISTLPWGTKSK